MASGRSMKDKSMAADLKARGIRRKTGQCPRCHRYAYSVTAIQSLYSHLNRCGGKHGLN